MVKIFSREIGTASANPMLLMKSVVIYVTDTGVRTITRPKVPARAFTQNDTVPPEVSMSKTLHFWGSQEHKDGAPGQNI